MLSVVSSAVLALSGAADGRIAELRDEGICNIGWVAGNAYGHPIWPQVREYVESGGVYYDAFVRLRAPGETDAQAAISNEQLYRDCRDRGGQQNFDESAAVYRIRRVIDITAELEQLF